MHYFKNIYVSIEVLNILKELKTDVKTLAQNFNTLNIKLDNMATEVHEKFEELRTENKHLKSELSRMSERLDDFECRNRRNNLIFHGIPGDINETWEMSEQKVRDFLSNTLDIENVNDIYIDRAHRLNTRNKDSPIIVKFVTTTDKNFIYRQAKETLSRDSQHRVNEDFPQHIREDRRALSHYFTRAQQAGKHPKVRLNKLIVDGNVFKYDRNSKSLTRVTPSTQPNSIPRWAEPDNTVFGPGSVNSSGEVTPNESNKSKHV